MAIDPQVLEHLRTGLRMIALRRLRDADAANEAVQEILTRVFDLVRSGRIPRPEELIPIAYGIARHVLADVIRSRLRAQRELPLAGSFEPASPAYDALAPLIAAEEHQRLRFALAQLGVEDRELLRLTFYEELTSSELGRRLGEPPERIRKRKSRALERLRRAFFGQPEWSGAEVLQVAGRHEANRAAIDEMDSMPPGTGIKEVE